MRLTAIARIVGWNAARDPRFNATVNMWVYEEVVNGRKLSSIINTSHENVKCVPERSQSVKTWAIG